MSRFFVYSARPDCPSSIQFGSIRSVLRLLNKRIFVLGLEEEDPLFTHVVSFYSTHMKRDFRANVQIDNTDIFFAFRWKSKFIILNTFPPIFKIFSF